MKKRELFKALLYLNIPIVLVLGTLVYFNIRATQFSLINSIIIPFTGIILINLTLYFFLGKLRSSVNSIAVFLDKIAKGNIESEEALKENNIFSVNEIGSKLDSITTELKNTVENIRRISNNDLNIEVESTSENQIIGNELFNLQEKLKKDSAILEQSKIDEDRRNWAAVGIAEFGDLLRQDSQNLKAMGYSIVSKLVDYIDSNQGALYVLNEDDGEEPIYEIVASVAYNRKKILDKKITVGDGLVGQCAFEKKTFYMTDIPQDYINITSGLGTANPATLLIIPCMIEESVLGIIEIASFKEIEPYQIEFIEKLGESIASSISTLRNSEKTNALLEASKHQADELAAQEEELRQNLEEMETTQEDLKRQMQLNSEIQQELKFEKILFDTLLEKIPSRIIFKDKNCKFIKASKSAVAKFGKTNYSEIVGLTDADLLNPEFARKTMKDEMEIMESGEAKIDFIEHEVKKNGEEIWKNVSKIPFYDEEGNCLGLFASISDITGAKILEKELAEEKKLFEIILNNIPGRIIFKDNKRRYIRASKSFLQKIGKESNDEVIGKTDYDFLDKDFADKTMADEKEIIESKKGRINFIEHEVKTDGSEIWKNVSKIPILDEEGNCNGIFASIYDLTEYKKVEVENQKLKEEIKKLKSKQK